MSNTAVPAETKKMTPEEEAELKKKGLQKPLVARSAAFIAAGGWGTPKPKPLPIKKKEGVAHGDGDEQPTSSNTVEGKEDNGEEKKKEKKKKKKKQVFGTLALPEYADDKELYRPVIDIAAREKFFNELGANPLRRKIPKGFDGWIKNELNDPDFLELDNFLAIRKFLLKVCTSSYWDFAWLFLLLVYCLGIGWYYDESIFFPVEESVPTSIPTASPGSGSGSGPVGSPTFAPTFAPTEPAIGLDGLTSISFDSADGRPIPVVLIHLILLLMFFVQLPPTLGIIYFVIFNNDMTRQLAKFDFQRWAINSCLIAQYIEFNYFGGKGRSGMKVRIDPSSSLFGTGDKDKDKGARGENEKKGKGMWGAFSTKGEKVHPGVSPPGSPGARSPGDGTPGSPGGAEEQFFNSEDVNNPDLELGAAWDDMSSLGEGGEGVQLNEMEGVEPPPLEWAPQEEEEEEEYDLLEVIRAERQAKLDAEAEIERLRIEREERKVRSWSEWQCIVCNKHCRRPTKPPAGWEMGYGETGQYYKRPYAIIVPSRPVPRCDRCFTYIDYRPPICSAHLFPNNPKPFVAFENYPIKPRIQSGLSPSPFQQPFTSFRNFFRGKYDEMSSKMVYNDWRLRLWARDQMMPIPRPFKKKKEFYQKGEVVECKVQKAGWARGRIEVIHTRFRQYNIKYAGGEEVKYVEERLIRLPAQKGAYAYRVELMLAIIIATFPICCAFALIGETARGLPFLGVFICTLLLLLLRVSALVESTIKYVRGVGFCFLLKIHSVFAAPVFFISIGSLVVMAAPSLGLSWSSAMGFFIFCKFATIPQLYIQRPTWGVAAGILYIQTSAGMIMLSMFMDGIALTDSFFLTMIPVYTSCLTLLIYRRYLPYVWDVCLTVRPPWGFDPAHDTLWGQLKGIYDAIFNPSPPKEEGEEREMPTTGVVTEMPEPEGGWEDDEGSRPGTAASLLSELQGSRAGTANSSTVGDGRSSDSKGSKGNEQHNGGDAESTGDTATEGGAGVTETGADTEVKGEDASEVVDTAEAGADVDPA
jgi:hypothetical protein